MAPDDPHDDHKATWHSAEINLRWLAERRAGWKYPIWLGQDANNESSTKQP